MCSVVTLGDLRGSMSDVDISIGSQPASRASSLDASSMDQQQLAQTRAAAQTTNMVLIFPSSQVLFIAFRKLTWSACQLFNKSTTLLLACCIRVTPPALHHAFILSVRSVLGKSPLFKGYTLMLASRCSTR